MQGQAVRSLVHIEPVHAESGHLSREAGDRIGNMVVCLGREQPPHTSYLHDGREQVPLDEIGKQAGLVRPGRDGQSNIDSLLAQLHRPPPAYDRVQGRHKLGKDGVD